MFSFSRATVVAALASLSLGLASCNKHCDPTPTPEQNATDSLVGRWELTQTTGGIAGGTTPADPARRRELLIDANGQLSLLLNGAVERTVPYQLMQRTSYLTRQSETFLYEITFIKQRTATNLVLVEDANDGFTHTYVRR